MAAYDKGKDVFPCIYVHESIAGEEDKDWDERPSIRVSLSLQQDAMRAASCVLEKIGRKNFPCGQTTPKTFLPPLEV